MANNPSSIIDHQLPRPLPLFAAERDVLVPPPTPSLVQWAEANYELPAETAALPGLWSSGHTPWLVEPMECMSDGVTGQIDIAACTQAGKTESTNAFVGYCVDVKPGPLLLVLPTEDVTKKRLRTRLRPMFRSNPKLCAKLPDGDIQNFRVGQETVLDGMILYIGWANSPITLSDVPVRYVILDEPTKYPAAVGAETDPISLAKKRQRTFQGRSKLIIVSSPLQAEDLFWQQWLRGDRCEWYVQCPRCGNRHVMQWYDPQRPEVFVVLDKTDKGNLLEPDEYEAGGHARYICPACRKAWTEYKRWQAVRAGRWVPAGCTLDDHSEIIGKVRTRRHRSFRVTALMLDPVFQTIDGLAAEWAHACRERDRGNIQPLKDFRTNQQAEPWREEAKKTEVEVLARHTDVSYRLGEVPAGVRILTAGFDVQLDHIWAVLIGWGVLNEAWWIWDERLETGDTEQPIHYEPVRAFMTATWPWQADPNRQISIIRGAIDCAYHTEAVETFCQKCQQERIGLLAARGSDHVRHRLYQAFKIERKAISRYDLNTGAFKDFLYHVLFETNQPGPDYLHLPRDVSDNTRLQLASQDRATWRDRGRIRREWRDKDTGVGPHKWDALVHARFAAMLAGVWRLASAETRPARTRNVQPAHWLRNLPDLKI